MKKKELMCIMLVGSLAGFILSSCGSSSSTTTTDTTSSTASTSFPSGMAVASPTASGATTASLAAGITKSTTPTIDTSETYVTKAAAFETILAAATDEVCQISLPNPSASATSPDCYGPALDYCDHTDFTLAAHDGDCTDSDALDAANDTDGDGQLPTGDLGIWTASESGEACTAAKINQLVEDIANKADYTMLLSASMVCLMKRAGTALPTTDGDSVTLTTDLNTAVQVNNPDVTVTSAIVENLTDINDGGTTRDAYQFTIVVTDDSTGSSLSISSYMKHMPTATDNSTYEGRIWAEIGGASGAGDKDAFAITYEKSAATSLKYQLRSANYQLADSSTTIFNTNGDIDVTGDWSGNFNQAIINIDPSTGLGAFSYAWQAGTGDGNARIFNGFTNAADGCGFFGYGDSFDNTLGTYSDNVIDGFICNWAGPNNDHSMAATTGESQKQCMTVNTTTGVFEIDASNSNIAYAPAVSCDNDGSMSLKLTTESTYDAAVITNDLITLASDTDYSGYTAPTAPSLPSGL